MRENSWLPCNFGYLSLKPLKIRCFLVTKTVTNLGDLVMDEKKIVYDVVLSVWNLAKEHGFEKLTDEQWDSLVEKATIERDKFKQHGENIDLLFRQMYMALQNYYERK